MQWPLTSLTFCSQVQRLIDDGQNNNFHSKILFRSWLQLRNVAYLVKLKVIALHWMESTLLSLVFVSYMAQ